MDEIGPEKESPPAFTTSEKVFLWLIGGVIAAAAIGYMLVTSWAHSLQGHNL